jgi:hypothetical protein
MMRMKRRQFDSDGNPVSTEMIISKDGLVSELLATANQHGVQVSGITMRFENGNMIEYTRDRDRERAVYRIVYLIEKDLENKRPLSGVTMEMSNIQRALKGAFL